MLCQVSLELLWMHQYLCRIISLVCIFVVPFVGPGNLLLAQSWEVYYLYIPKSWRCDAIFATSIMVILLCQKSWDKNIGHGSSPLSQNKYRFSTTWIVLLLLFCTLPETIIFTTLVVPCIFPTVELIPFNRIESGPVNSLRIRSRVRVPPICHASRYFIRVSAY